MTLITHHEGLLSVTYDASSFDELIEKGKGFGVAPKVNIFYGDGGVEQVVLTYFSEILSVSENVPLWTVRLRFSGGMRRSITPLDIREALNL